MPDTFFGLRPDPTTISDLANEVTIAQSGVAKAAGRHSCFLQKGLDLCDELSVHVHHNTCDASHRQGVKQPLFNGLALACDTTHMIEPTPFSVVQDAIRREMRRRGTKPKPLSVAAGLGETAVRDLLRPTAGDIKFTTLAKLAGHLDVPVSALASEAASVAPPQPPLPNATDFAKILGAVAPLASASLGNEAVLQALGGHFRAMVELRLQHPDYSIERILGSLDERLRGLDDQTSRPE